MWGRAPSVPLGPERLAARRRLRRRRVRIALSILFGLTAGMLLWGLNQSYVRISEITVYGADQSLADYVRRAMQGSYLGIVPRDSTFFYPDIHIRKEILAEHPEIAAVSLFREGFIGLSVKIHERVPIARWCGSTNSPQAVSSEERCYVFDASGYVFAADASTTPKLNPFSLYAHLAGDTEEPLRATLVHADELPASFDFARQLGTLGSPVAKAILRDDEVDDLLASGTRVTYVLGHEQDAYTALVSASANLDLADGSVEHVDLRFSGKVYVKRR